MRILIIMVLLLCVGCVENKTIATSSRSYDPSVIRVLGIDYPMTNHGSGVVTKYGSETIIITALHVISESKEIRFETKSRESIGLEIYKRIDIKGLDVSVLYVRNMLLKVKSMPISNDLLVGDRVSAIGFPAGGDCVSESGNISGIKMSSTCKIKSGMSGGPVVSNGKLVGISTGAVINMDNGSRGGEHISIIDIIRHLDK